MKGRVTIDWAGGCGIHLLCLSGIYWQLREYIRIMSKEHRGLSTHRPSWHETKTPAAVKVSMTFSQNLERGFLLVEDSCYPLLCWRRFWFFLMYIYIAPLAWTDIYFVTIGSCNPSLAQACSHWLTHTTLLLLSYWLTQSAHILMLSSYWFSRLQLQEMLVGNTIFVSLSEACRRHFQPGTSPSWIDWNLREHSFEALLRTDG